MNLVYLEEFEAYCWSEQNVLNYIVCQIIQTFTMIQPTTRIDSIKNLATIFLPLIDLDIDTHLFSDIVYYVRTLKIFLNEKHMINQIMI